MAESQGRDLDQEYEELLQELRVTMPGLQVLFAFLLILPFSNRFAEVSSVERGVFLAAFFLAAVASVFLIGPSAFHRLRWRQHDKEAVLRVSHALAMIGTGLLALAVSCSVYLVTSFVYETSLAAVTTAVTAALIVVIWYAMPLARRSRDGG